MKNFAKILIVAVCLAGASSCDKGFKELNINPNSPTSLNASFLFTNAEYLTNPGSGSMETDPTIIQAVH